MGIATKAVVEVIGSKLAERGMSRLALEEASGIKHNRMGIIFRMESPITVEETRIICDALGISVVSVIREAEAMWGAVENVAAERVRPVSPTPLPVQVVEVYDGSQPPERSAAQAGDVGAEQGTPDDLGEYSQVPPEDWD